MAARGPRKRTGSTRAAVILLACAIALPARAIAQIRRMAGIFYTYVGHEHLGAVAWQ
jgi:hypothetical protein